MRKKLFLQSQMKISRLEVKQFERRRQNCNLFVMALPPPLRANAQAEFFLQRWNDFLADPQLLGAPNASKMMPFGHFRYRPPQTLSIVDKAFASPRSWRPSFLATVRIPSSPF